MRSILAGVAAVGLLWLSACTSKDESDSDTDGLPVEQGRTFATYVPEGYGTAEPSRIVFVGDSITAGYGATHDELAYAKLLEHNDSDTWPGFDDADLEVEASTATWINVAVPGAITDDVLRDQLPRLETQLGENVVGPTIVIMTIGGNDVQSAMLDILSGDPSDVVDHVVGNVRTTLEWFQDAERFPDGAYIYFTNVYDPTDNQGQVQACFFGIDLNALRPYLTDVNAGLRALAVERGASMIDLYGSFQGHGYTYDNADLTTYIGDDPTLWFASDCIHPNDRGHHELRREFAAAVRGEVYTP